MENIRLTPRWCKAARYLIGWQQKDLADASDVPLPTIRAFEAGDESKRLMGVNNSAIVSALEHAGVKLVPENGSGFGVILRDKSLR